MENGSTGILTRENTQKFSGGVAPGPLPQLARWRKRHLARALPTGGLASLVHYYQAVLPPKYVLHPGPRTVIQPPSYLALKSSGPRYQNFVMWDRDPSLSKMLELLHVA